MASERAQFGKDAENKKERKKHKTKKKMLYSNINKSRERGKKTKQKHEDYLTEREKTLAPYSSLNPITHFHHILQESECHKVD